METLKLTRGNIAFPHVLIDNDTSSQRTVIIKTENIDVDLTASFAFSQDGINSVPLTNAAGDAITLSIPASAGKAGVMLTDISAKYLHVSIAVAAGKVVPVISAETAGTITATGADIAATVNPGGSATSVFVQFGTQTGVYTDEIEVTESPISAGTSNVNVTKTLEDLIPETEYFFRIKTWNSVGIVFGDEESFTTIAE